MERGSNVVGAGFLRDIPKVQIFCGGMPAYALHVIKAEGLGWYCSRCGKRVKVVT